MARPRDIGSSFKFWLTSGIGRGQIRTQYEATAIDRVYDRLVFKIPGYDRPVQVRKKFLTRVKKGKGE
jgi:hypothetical protein